MCVLTRLGMICAVVLLWAGPGRTCPTTHARGHAVETVTGEDLRSRVVAFQVIAGGTYFLPNCGYPSRGFTTGAPDFELQVSGIAGAPSLVVEARAGCDTLLLLNDARGQWFFDDDSGAGLAPRLHLRRPANGTYRLWVGTFGEYTCRTTLRLYLGAG